MPRSESLIALLTLLAVVLSGIVTGCGSQTAPRARAPQGIVSSNLSSQSGANWSLAESGSNTPDGRVLFSTDLGGILFETDSLYALYATENADYGDDQLVTSCH